MVVFRLPALQLPTLNFDPKSYNSGDLLSGPITAFSSLKHGGYRFTPTVCDTAGNTTPCTQIALMRISGQTAIALLYGIN